MVCTLVLGRLALLIGATMLVVCLFTVPYLLLSGISFHWNKSFILFLNLGLVSMRRNRAGAA